MGSTYHHVFDYNEVIHHTLLNHHQCPPPPLGDVDELVEARPSSSMEIIAAVDNHVQED